jgi:hypothetical protein
MSLKMLRCLMKGDWKVHELGGLTKCQMIYV